MTKQQESFLKNEFLTLSLFAALGRSNTYVPSAPEPDKIKARTALRVKLQEVGARYVHSAIDDERHCEHIREIADAMTSNYSHILRDGRFRFGVAQKALNLYLKYLWCVRLIPPPPHCPFDSIVLSKLRETHHNWTAIDSLQDYMALVTDARTVAGGVSLADWELGLWNARS